MKALFPRATGQALEAVLINTAGGVTGGDHFSNHFHARAGAALTLTSQTAERAYRALPDQTGRLKNTITVEDGASVRWLPQETILFQGSAIRRTLTVNLAPQARFLMVEALVFGRASMGEVLTYATFSDRIEFRQSGKIRYLDAINLHGNIAEQLARPHVANGAGAMASLVYIAPDASAHLTPLRALLGAQGGASLLGDDMIVLRCVAQDSYLLRKTLIPALTLLTNETIPRCWMT